MSEQSTPVFKNRYQNRLESATQLADYDDLSDDVKARVAQLAYDKDLDMFDFNEAVGAELADHRLSRATRKKVGTPALTGVVERPTAAAERTLSNLPQAFEDARIRSRGLSVDQIAGHGLDFQRAGKRELFADEKSFFSDGGLIEYEKELNDFMNKLEQENPYPETRKVRGELQDNPFTGLGWRHMNSKEYIRSRKDGDADAPSSRIYLSPRYGMDMIAIYKEVFERAEQSGLRFKAKVFATAINQLSDASQIQQALTHYAEESHRVDPMLFYPFEESKDAMLQIVAQVYEEHQDAFKGARTGIIPAKIAPGFAVGDEPHGVSGNESLTSHREKFLRTAQAFAQEHPRWGDASKEQKRTIHLEALRRVAGGMNIDPDNIAFDLVD